MKVVYSSSDVEYKNVQRFLSVDPLASKYPQWSTYAFCYNNPIQFVDLDGREGVPVTLAPFTGITYPKIKPYQWYTLQGDPLSGSFNKAALYNIAHNNSWAYINISERHQFYNWADKQLSGKSKWFAAAATVTSRFAVGAADKLNLWYLSDGADKFLQEGNKYLFKYNMANAKSLINTGGLTGSFTDANGIKVSFDGLKGKALDYAMVQLEQTKIQGFMDNYQKNNPNADMSEIMKSINGSMGSSFAPEAIKNVMDKYFNTDNGQKAFDFGSYNDRVKLGEKMIDQLYQK